MTSRKGFLPMTGLAVLLTLAAAATLPADDEAPAGPRIAVKRFDDKSGKGYRDIGSGMADMLATALHQSGRFTVLERQAIADVLEEQDLATSGRIKGETAAPTGEILGAQFIINGAITAFEPDYKGVAGGAALTKLGTGVAAGAKQSYVALDLRVIDAATSRIVASLSVEGTATDVAGGAALTLGGGKSTLGLGLAGFSKTPMEKAVRLSIEKAVEQVSASVP